jgi:hypothetical protein
LMASRSGCNILATRSDWAVEALMCMSSI